MKRPSGLEPCVRVPVSTLVREMTVARRRACAVSARSVFSDSVWDFQDDYPSSPRCDVKFRFDLKLKSGSLADGSHEILLDSLKCLIYSLLFDPPHLKLGITTVMKAMCPGHGIWHIYVFMADHCLTGLRKITEDAFSELLSGLCNPAKSSKITERTLLSRIRGIYWIGLQAEKLVDRLLFTPWKDHRAAGVWARNNAQVLINKSELSTQPWPDTLVRDMVKLSLKVLSTATQVEAMFAPGHPSSFVRRKAYVHLRSSVGLLSAIFSGMRMKEVASISNDLKKCISVVEIRQNDRVVRGLFIHSLQSKKTVPFTDKWQTIPIVHDAIKALIRIDELIPIDYKYLLHSNRCEVERDAGRRLSVQVFMNALNAMAREHGVDLSAVNGHIKSLDFRRTFARLVTRNGLGVLELQSQLKHIEPNLTMRYGAPALREHLLSERQNFTRDQYKELIAGTCKVIGGGASEVKEMRAYFVGLKRGEKREFLETLPKDALISQAAEGLCRYRPHLALCKGNMLACKPADCNNSIILAEEFDKTVAFRVEENKRLLKHFARNPAKREHLKAVLVMLTKLRDQSEEP